RCLPLKRKPPDHQAPPQGRRRRRLRFWVGGGGGGGVLQERADHGRQLVCRHIEGVVATQIGGQDRPRLVDECPHLVEERGFVWHGVRTLLPRMSPDHYVRPDKRSGGAASPRPGS